MDTEALSFSDQTDVLILTGDNAEESGASTDPGATVSSNTTNYTEMSTKFSTEFFRLCPTNNDSQANDNTDELFRDQLNWDLAMCIDLATSGQRAMSILSHISPVFQWILRIRAVVCVQQHPISRLIQPGLVCCGLEH